MIWSSPHHVYSSKELNKRTKNKKWVVYIIIPCVIVALLFALVLTLAFENIRCRSQDPLVILKQTNAEDTLLDAPTIYTHSSTLLSPNPSLEDAQSSDITDPRRRSCNFDTCVNYDRCRVKSGFPVSVRTYGTQDQRVFRVVQAIRKSAHSRLDSPPCFEFVVANDGIMSAVQKRLTTRPVRSIDGSETYQNEAYIRVSSRTSSILEISSIADYRKRLQEIPFHAVVIDSVASFDDFRPKFDLVVPPLPVKENAEVFPTPFLPAKRKLFLSFQGSSSGKNMPTNAILSDLAELRNANANIQMSLECTEDEETDFPVFDGDWRLCQNRQSTLQDSTFCLTLAPTGDFASTPSFQTRFAECLRFGAVPVVVGQARLPFDETVDWTAAAAFIPLPRLGEALDILNEISDEDIVGMRRQGYYLWKSYLSSDERIMDAVVSTLRGRMGVLGMAREVAHSKDGVFNSSSMSPFVDIQRVTQAYSSISPDDLVPKDNPNDMVGKNWYQAWNKWFDPHYSYSSRPSTSELEFKWNMFPEARETGGKPISSEQEDLSTYGEAAFPGTEDFTIIFLTYHRDEALVGILRSFAGLKLVNKIIVVWNDERSLPAADFWPDIGINLEVVKATKNSLNNRFIPFTTIETEAVLTVDEDVQINHEDILFGFRVWQEAKERMVGFVPRQHSWGAGKDKWVYRFKDLNKDFYTAAFSLALTGGVFVHKYYLYLYAYNMSPEILNKNDDIINCEDIAMNYLVSHLTRLPPIWIDSNTTFACSGCKEDGLSQMSNHYQERELCVNYFAKIYGYMPLMYSYFRASKARDGAK